MSETDTQLELEQPGPDPDLKPNSASAMLLAARLRTGFTQKEVADQLFLTTSFIRFIDDGEFDKIPKPAFVKGYLRSYARVVELSGDEVVACYEESRQTKQAQVEIKDVTDERLGSSSYTGPVFLTGAIGMGAVLLVILLVWLFSDSGETTTDAGAAGQSGINGDSVEAEALQLPSRSLSGDAFGMRGVSVTESSLGNGPGADVAASTAGALDETQLTAEEQLLYEDEEMAASFSSVAATPAELARINDEQDSTPGADEAATVAASQAEDSLREIVRGRVTEGGQEIVTISAGGDDELYFEFSDDCWLEVEDADGVAIYGDLNRRGDALRITGAAPFAILLGKAPVVNLKFNGSAVDVARYTSNDDTAKLRLANSNRGR